MEKKLTREIYKFEKPQFIYIDTVEGGTTITKEQGVILKVELMINYEEGTFVMNFDNVLDVNTGIIKLYGPNHFGNTDKNIKASIEFYKWISDICVFADTCLNPSKATKKDK